MNDLAGHIILHYKIIEKLGEGGMGVVYLAEDTKLERNVALKFLPHNNTSNLEERERLKLEAKAAASLNHPNIATIYAIEEYEDAHGDVRSFITMEYIEGKELKSIIEAHLDALLPIDDVINYANQIAEGLEAAHKKGITHRDIKSSNILITNDGKVKIMDFGLAKMLGRTKLTMVGSTVGTVDYMSPEQARGTEVDQRSDIWSFGIVLYEMLTGQLPFRSAYEQAVVYAIINEEPKSVITLRPETPGNLETILTKCLTKRIENRYQNTQELLDDLLLLKGSAPAVRSSGKLFRRISRKHFLLIIPLIVLCLVFFGYFFIKGLGSNNEAGASENSLAVMYFENQSGEKDIDRVLVNMLTTNLARYKGLKVISSQHLFDILKSLGKQDVQAIDMSVATEVAHDAKVNRIITGSIIKIGTKFRVTAQLLDVNTGNIVNSYQEDGNKPEDVFVMVDGLTEKIESNFLLPDVVAAGSKPLKIKDVTTNSYEAFKHYENGLEKLWRWEVDDAAKEFEIALKIDSTFAMAYLQLAISKANNSLLILAYDYNIIPIRDLINRANFYSSKATDNERWFIHVNKALFDRNFQTADSLAKKMVSIYPQDREANTLFSLTSWFVEKYEQAIRANERVLEIDPNYSVAYDGLAYLYSFLGDHQNAISSIKKAISLQPGVDNDFDTAFEMYLQANQPQEAFQMCDQWEKLKGSPPFDYLAYIYLFIGNGEKAREEYRKEIAKDHQSELWLITEIAFSYVYEGRFSEAIVEFKNCLKKLKLSKSLGFEIYTHFNLGKTYLARANYAEALEQFSEAEKVSSSIYSKTFDPVQITSQYFIGLTYAKEGDYQKARLVAEKIKLLIEKDHYDTVFMDFYQLLYGAIYLSRSNAQDASNSISKLSPFTKMFPRRQTLIASIRNLSGNDQEAISAFNKFRDRVTFKNNYMGGDHLDYLLERSRVNYNLAKLYEKDGSKNKAIEYYSKALKQWNNADKNMPELIDTKLRLHRLTDLKRH